MLNSLDSNDRKETNGLFEALNAIEQLAAHALARLEGHLERDQIELYDLAFIAAETTAAREALQMIDQGDPKDRPLLTQLANVFVAEVIVNSVQRLQMRQYRYGLTARDFRAELLEHAANFLSSDYLTEVGRTVVLAGGELPTVGLDDERALIRDTFRDFATRVVMPRAADVHRGDQIVPDEILLPLREMGCFGLSVPQRFGGLKPDDHEDSLGMVVVTEELSRGSLGAAGSLITRPEIMARALLEGGTSEQQARWLPRLASGESLCAISVTEPNTGSDVASVSLRATPVADGWVLNGGKTWCTFAGKANVILVLARTDVAAQPPHKGLSLFLVEKPSSDGHDFEFIQPGGGRVTGRAIATLGYRGMHSYEMFYDDFFVPDANLVGGRGGEGKGFYFTMRGFMGGRLQTAARACGLMQAAMEASIAYASQRRVFGQPIADFPLTLAKIARMAAQLSACRHFTYAVARLMDQDQGQMEASLVKLLACRVAESVSREALQIHGGMGYAEETAVSRYFVDARVLSIFEGAEETLAIRVIGKALLDQRSR
ncbi:MAG: acyl-CoA dehydrogenase family protein [Pseudomonadales bacterium]